MNRREAVKYISLLLGGTLAGAGRFLTGCKGSVSSRSFSPGDIAFLDEVADTILPDTDTPGAKAAGVGTFITIMVNDCYSEKEQQVFIDGMSRINELAIKKFGKEFINCVSGVRYESLTLM